MSIDSLFIILLLDNPPGVTCSGDAVKSQRQVPDGTGEDASRYDLHEMKTPR
jgi:hypothetical protein